jgi:hypothetical protein
LTQILKSSIQLFIGWHVRAYRLAIDIEAIAIFVVADHRQNLHPQAISLALLADVVTGNPLATDRTVSNPPGNR